ncbi:MAG: type I restriction enzyme HsdR N-terminal domain-containing protein [Bacteroidales bacterium]|nr:type I restriction enzyme HsdR N-terminal domain-containing protein [Bacteroidales bacterium]
MFTTKTRIKNNKKEIFDPIRKIFVPLTPEEAVRQAYILHLVNDLSVPPIEISVEKKIVYSGQTKKYDIVAQHIDKCLVVVECKAPSVALQPKTLQQAAMYNHILHAKYIVLINGKQCLVYMEQQGEYLPIEALPSYQEILKNI